MCRCGRSCRSRLESAVRSPARAGAAGSPGSARAPGVMPPPRACGRPAARARLRGRRGPRARGGAPGRRARTPAVRRRSDSGPTIQRQSAEMAPGRCRADERPRRGRIRPAAPAHRRAPARRAGTSATPGRSRPRTVADRDAGRRSTTRASWAAAANSCRSMRRGSATMPSDSSTSVLAPSQPLQGADQRLEAAQRDARLRPGMLGRRARLLFDLLRARVAAAGAVVGRPRRARVFGERPAALAQHHVGEPRADAIRNLGRLGQSDVEAQKHRIALSSQAVEPSFEGRSGRG